MTAALVTPPATRVPARRARLLGRLTRKERVGIGIVVLTVALGFVVPMVSPFGVNDQDLGSRLLAPSGEHWFGTDEFGRDVFLRTFAAARIDVLLALVGALLPLTVGSLIGSVSGFAGRWVDVVLMRIADVIQALPGYVFMLSVALVIGPGVKAYLVAALTTAWVPYARLTRAQVLVVRELDYVKAARTSGIGNWQVVRRHILPNAIPQTLVYFASDVVICLLALAGLSFLGFGVAPPTAEWGGMIAGGQAFVRSSWWMTFAPGVMIIVVGAAFALISEGIDERRRA